MNVLPEMLFVMERDYQSKVVRPIVLLIGDLLAGDDSITQYCLDLNVIYHLKQLLNQPESDNVRFGDILWCFSTIAEGTKDHISVLI